MLWWATSDGAQTFSGVSRRHVRREVPVFPVRCRRTRTDCARACGAVWVGRWVGRRAATSLWYLDCSSGLLERHLSRRNAIITAMQANALTVERGVGRWMGRRRGVRGPQRGVWPGWLLLCIGPRRLEEREAMHHPACSRRALFCGRSMGARGVPCRDGIHSGMGSRIHSASFPVSCPCF